MFRVSIKGVLLVDCKVVLVRNDRRGWELPGGGLEVGDKVVLVRNDRRGWELPGGGLEVGEVPERTLEREFEEELALKVEAGPIIDSYLFEVLPGKHVFIVTYGCRLRGGFAPVLSDEHTEFGLYAPIELERIELPEGYARSIRSWSAHAVA
jgi:8-oxo-dGTP pyrophosphatase MutT (NUDIX family)